MKKAIALAIPILISAAACASTRATPDRPAMPSQGVAVPLGRIHFPFASRRTGPGGSEPISMNSRWMKENPAAVVVLEGHCDERGSDERNMELGDRRARWVMGRMMEEGVPAKRFIVVSHGERRPVDPSHNTAAWRRNRRVEFLVR